jgi:hypothetical protein
LIHYEPVITLTKIEYAWHRLIPNNGLLLVFNAVARYALRCLAAISHYYYDLINQDIINMKLAEALNIRSDMNRRLQELRERILRNAKYQEGDSPSEDPTALISEYELLNNSYMDLVIRINQTNNTIALSNGKDMVYALAQREVLKQKHSTYRALAAEATPKQDRYSKKEIKFLSAVDVRDIQLKADGMAKDLRELDSLVQQANWNNDLA